MAKLPPNSGLDLSLVLLPLGLVSFGLVMIASASIDYAAVTFGDAFFYLKRHLLFIVLSLTGATFVAAVPSQLWSRLSPLLLLVGILLLVAVLIPGVGKMVNGSRRWISLGGFALQASELAKFCCIIFFASFLARRHAEINTSWSAFATMLAILGIFLVLLLAEPDFGSAVVLAATVGAMMLVAGVPILRFLLLALVGIGALVVMAVSAEYRWRRLVTFLDPWADRFDDGYQLTQSLIAFGRGEWLGLGLGNSLQKLFFLPEAHTDFIFAIVAEELGLVGVLAVIAAFCALVTRVFLLARRAQLAGRLFACFTAVGAGAMLAAQALINMGVASGFLPTKGLTLPFISAGGSSLLVCGALIGLLARMEWELRHET